MSDIEMDDRPFPEQAEALVEAFVDAAGAYQEHRRDHGPSESLAPYREAMKQTREKLVKLVTKGLIANRFEMRKSIVWNTIRG